MRRGMISAAVIVLAMDLAYAELPEEFDRSDRLFQLGLLDVTKAPYLADPTGTADSTEAIQRAVNDARDHGLVCFFPEGTYLISDTISCEQQVRKLDRPRIHRRPHPALLGPLSPHRHLWLGQGKATGDQAVR